MGREQRSSFGALLSRLGELPAAFESAREPGVLSSEIELDLDIAWRHICKLGCDLKRFAMTKHSLVVAAETEGCVTGAVERPAPRREDKLATGLRYSRAQ